MVGRFDTPLFVDCHRESEAAQGGAVKAERQIRAERLAERFRSAGRKPVVLEFAGIPKAGKTTTIGNLHAFLKRCGFRVETVIERASLCPIRDKKHANFNVWTTCTTLAQILEKTQTPPRPDDPDILILDRGLFDSLCWLTMMERLSRLRSEDLEIFERFLMVEDWRKRISAVFVMIASAEDSLDREKGYLPVEGSSGSIMNVEVLEKTISTTREMVDRLKNDFRIHLIDTSSTELRGDPRRTAETVADLTLDIIEQQLREEILIISKVLLSELFVGKTCLRASDALKIAGEFQRSGEFLPRDQVETRSDLVQALPVVVVRKKSGDILLLRRREASPSNPLHEKLVIWAGGHVRIEDGENGDAILRGAVRELQEELRLSVEPDELRLIGSVYVPAGERTEKHVALVYEWFAETDDVAVALSNAEFFERRGNSLSGRFLSLESLVRDVKEGKIEEPWSQEIVRELLAVDSFAPRLF